jgi:DNA repair protein RecO (recombination protein O)
VGGRVLPRAAACGRARPPLTVHSLPMYFTAVRLLATDSLVLHSFDYRETSRIVKLATREAGIVSVIARGAKGPKSKFGSALDLFTSGVAHFTMHPSRELHTLTGFDANRTRPELAGSMARFNAASAISELCLRFAKEEDDGGVHDAVVAALEAIGTSLPNEVPAAALAGAWRVIAELGFAPSLDECVSCHARIAPGEAAVFNHRAGGVLCERCAARSRGGRSLPPEARLILAAWLSGAEVPLPDAGTARAHQRLLREFLEEHLGDGRALRAFITWEEQVQGTVHVPMPVPVP